MSEPLVYIGFKRGYDKLELLAKNLSPQIRVNFRKI